MQFVTIKSAFQHVKLIIMNHSSHKQQQCNQKPITLTSIHFHRQTAQTPLLLRVCGGFAKNFFFCVCVCTFGPLTFCGLHMGRSKCRHRSTSYVIQWLNKLFRQKAIVCLVQADICLYAISSLQHHGSVDSSRPPMTKHLKHITTLILALVTLIFFSLYMKISCR